MYSLVSFDSKILIKFSKIIHIDATQPVRTNRYLIKPCFCKPSNKICLCDHSCFHTYDKINSTVFFNPTLSNTKCHTKENSSYFQECTPATTQAATKNGVSRTVSSVTIASASPSHPKTASQQSWLPATLQTNHRFGDDKDP